MAVDGCVDLDELVTLQKYTGVFRSAARWLSSQAPPLVTRNVEGFELSSSGSSGGSQHQRPVVVLIGWLNAKRKHLRKYQELYCGRGMDVLTMPVSPIHVVRPRTGVTYTRKLLKVLQVGMGKENAPGLYWRFSCHTCVWLVFPLLTCFVLVFLLLYLCGSGVSLVALVFLLLCLCCTGVSLVMPVLYWCFCLATPECCAHSVSSQGDHCYIKGCVHGLTCV